MAQDFPGSRISIDMERGQSNDVRCRSCATVYLKPTEGGTIARNPGCPTCGYVGWVPVTLSAAWQRDRSDADRPLLRVATRG